MIISSSPSPQTTTVGPLQVDTLSRTFSEKRMTLGENVSLKKVIDYTYRPEHILGESEAAKEIRRFVDRVSQTDFTVLLTGEGGTGKEFVARAIHLSSKRKERKILFVHCAALPEPFLERELFGYEKDAFPEARQEKRGLLEEAEGGTVLLVGIGEMGLSVQAKLLMALDKRTFRRVGADREISFDAMVVATTDDDVGKLVENGTFRRDLFYRLDMFALRLPSLRDRKEDIPLFAEHFFSQYKTEFRTGALELTPGAIEALKKYHWPGNLRELKGLLAKVCLLEESNIINPEHILARLELSNPLEQVASLLESDLSLGDIEKNLICESLKKAKGNMTKAARMLNVSYDTLRYRMKKFAVK